MGIADIDSAQGATMVAEGGAQVTFQEIVLGSIPAQQGTLVVTGSGTEWQNVAGTNGFSGGMIIATSGTRPARLAVSAP